MKTLKMTAILFFMLAVSFSFCQAQNQDKPSSDNPQSVDTSVEVYYFHFTRRCAGCKAVEAETQKALQDLYPEQMKNGRISFKSINMDETENEAVMASMKVSAQTLLVVHGDKREDLTDIAFMNARSKPEKLHEAIKKAIGQL